MLGVCKFVVNQKKRKTALFRGHQYTFHKTNEPKKHWRCVKYTTNRCPGRITTLENEVLKTSEHSHVPDERNSEIRIALSNMRKKAATSSSPPRRIIRSTIVEMSKTSAVEMKSYETLARNIRRVRRNENPTPVLPATLKDFVIPDEYMVTATDQQFLLHDNNDPVKRTIIFATKDNLSFLVHCDDWYMDGTFDICPPLFKQLYTIHGRRNNQHFPLVYVLACKKDYFTYEGISNQLKSAEPRLHPQKIMMDFEKAAIKAADDVFSGVEVSGCFLHFCQCLYRQNQACGLQKHNIENTTIALHMRCLASLAFVPEGDVVRHFETLKTFTFFATKLNGKSDVDVGVQKLLLYMETNWIGTKRRTSYKPGMFELKLWNVYQLTLELFPRTNNIVEAWHNAMSILFPHSHPDVFKFLSGIKLEQAATEVAMDKMFSGIVVTPNKKIEKIKERMLNVVKSYINKKIDIEKYLLGLAQSVSFTV